MNRRWVPFIVNPLRQVGLASAIYIGIQVPNGKESLLSEELQLNCQRVCEGIVTDAVCFNAIGTSGQQFSHSVSFSTIDNPGGAAV